MWSTIHCCSSGGSSVPTMTARTLLSRRALTVAVEQSVKKCWHTTVRRNITTQKSTRIGTSSSSSLLLPSASSLVKNATFQSRQQPCTRRLVSWTISRRPPPQAQQQPRKIPLCSAIYPKQAQNYQTRTQQFFPQKLRSRRNMSSPSNGGGGGGKDSAILISEEQCAQDLAELGQHPTEILETLARKLSQQERNEIAAFLRHSRAATNGGSNGSTKTAATAAMMEIPEPSQAELRMVAINTGIPFVGFGIMDNAILIVAGDAIDTSLGVTLGISTMCAAAIGNIISDVAGIMLGTAVEDFCAKYLNLPTPDLSTAQRQLRSVRYANQLGCGVGMIVGCIIGMFPLFFIDSHKIQARKREAEMDAIFKDVINEASSLIGADRTVLFLIVNKDDNASTTTTAAAAAAKDKAASPVPRADGKYLYAKYSAFPAATTTASDHQQEQQLKQLHDLIPLGRGIVSRAALTGEAWNIYDVSTEPEFAPEIAGGGGSHDDGTSSNYKVRNMLCVPVLDVQGRPIAVIQAINKRQPPGAAAAAHKNEQGQDNEEQANSTTSNKKNEPSGFTNHDVQILKALASHISVSLQRMYYDADGNNDDEVRLKDTIRMLKDYGLAGIAAEDMTSRRPLFPED